MAAHLSANDYGLAGFVSGFLTRTIVQPLDVVKIRFQLQYEPTSLYVQKYVSELRPENVVRPQLSSGKYTGVVRALFSIAHEEGFLSLWKGFVPGQLLSVTYGTVQFTSFELTSGYLKSQLSPNENHDGKLVVINAVSGAIAGTFSIGATYPLDLIRTRLVAHNKQRAHHSMTSVCSKVLAKDGWLGFYKGLVPAILTYAPQTGIQFTIFKGMASLYSTKYGAVASGETGAIQSTIFGFVAGAGSKLVVFPFDVLKKRLQMIGYEDTRKSFGKLYYYTGLLDAMKSMFTTESILGFYKGLWPSLLKAGVSSATIFLFYEQCCAALLFLRSN